VNSSATAASTMNRLGEMQLCPALRNRPRAAMAATRGRSASERTTNGSEPPSSSTDFLVAVPAADPTARPARSLPVMVTAPMRGSSIRRRMTTGTSRSSTTRAVNRPSGAPASVSTRCTASAQPVVFGECFNSAALPAMSAGAANRSTCHSGKFQGMTASTTPTGS
jgi:hypothetical protein